MQITFESEAEMREALKADSYKKAVEARSEYMQATSAGIHSLLVDETVTLV